MNIIPSIANRFFKMLLIATVFLGAFTVVPQEAKAQSADASLFSTAGTTAEAKFSTLQQKMKGFAVIVLLIMLVIAGVMAAMQKVQMAINIAIGAIVLFGGAYIILLINQGLQ